MQVLKGKALFGANGGKVKIGKASPVAVPFRSGAIGARFMTQSQIKDMFGSLFSKRPLADEQFHDCDGMEEIACADDFTIVVRRTLAEAPHSSCFAVHLPGTKVHTEYRSRFNLKPGARLTVRQKWNGDKWMDLL
jgi:hypothetical protein